MRNGKPPRMDKDRNPPIEVEVGGGNVFADLGLADADELLAKSHLVLRIDMLISERNLTHAKAATLLGVERARLRRLLAGDLDMFPIERLFQFLNALGQEVEIVVRPATGRGKRRLIKVVELQGR